MSSDQQFEKTFADLAHANLQDRSPKLLESLIGFQVIEKDDDDTRAVGIFAFVINEAYYYAPVFFLDGELKGSTLLYVKSADIFIPLQEKWVNYITNNKMPSLGESAEERVQGSSPDLNPYITPPGATKFANSHFLGGILTNKLGDSVELDLRTTIKSMPESAKVKLAKAMRSDEAFTEAIMKFYDVNELLSTPSYEAPIQKRAATEDTVKVVYHGDETSTNLSSDDRKTLNRDGVVIIDDRKKTTPVFDGAGNRRDSDLLTQRFSNPEAGMIARVLMGDGELVKCLIIRNIDDNLDVKVMQDKYLVLELSGKKYATTCTYKQNIYVPTDDLPYARQEFLEWVDSNKEIDGKQLKKPSSGPSVYNDNDSFLAVDGVGNAVCLSKFSFSQAETLKPGVSIDLGYGGFNHFDVQDSSALADGINNAGGSNHTHFSHDNGTAHITKGRKIKVTSSATYVPASCAVIDAPTGKRMNLGIPNLMSTDVLASADFQHVKINSDSIEYIITDTDGQSTPLNKSAAIVKLATEYGVHGSMASRMVNDAYKPGRRAQAKFIIKKAFNNQGFEDVAPLQYDPQLDVNTIRPDSSSNKVEELRPGPLQDRSDPNIIDNLRRSAVDAANLGEKEILDTAVLTGLANNEGATSMVDGYMKSLVTGLDRVGRILFLFYWHNEKFRQRYGAQDMQSLEDSLNTVFDSMGDLILFLKEKTATIDTLLSSNDLELEGSI